MVVADEHRLHVIFYIEERDPNWDGTTVRVVGPDSEGEPTAIVSFSRYTAYFHGPPNDEAFSGHPLSDRGLDPYGAYEVQKSSWIKRLIEMNRVHPYQRDESFTDCRHFILSFHDSVFECVARDYTVSLGSGSILKVVEKALHDFKN
jgi:hypothetical protein